MKTNTYISVLVLGILVLPMVVFAQPVFKPLVGVPGVTDPHINFNDYINTIYALSISIAALLAVIKIIIAGVKWMLSDVVTSKQEAKGEIQGALLGLLIISSAFLILNEINPNLTKTSLITSKVDRPTNYNTAPTGGNAPLGGGGTPTAPGATPTAPTIKPDQTIACGGADGRDCNAAKQQCSASGGEEKRGLISSASSLTCSYSRTTPLICDTKLSSLDGVTQEIDCTARESECTGAQGGTWSHPDENIGRGYCTVPIKT